MDGSIMPFIAEVQTAPPPAAPPGAKTAGTARTKTGDTFGSVLAGVVSSGQPASDSDGKQQQPSAAENPLNAMNTTAMLGLFVMPPVQPVISEGSTPVQTAAVNTIAPASAGAMPTQQPPLSAATNGVATETTEGSQAGAASTVPPDLLTAQSAQATTGSQRQNVSAGMPQQQGVTGQPAQASVSNSAAEVQNPAPDVAPLAAQTTPSATNAVPVPPAPVAQPAPPKAADAHPQVVATVATAETNGILPAKTAAPLEQSPVQNQVSTPVVAAANTAGTGDNDGSGLSADIFADKEPAAVLQDTAANNPPVSFAGVLHHNIKNEQPVSNLTTPQAPPDTHNVLDQIVDQARFISRPNNSEMVIRLKPEHLGELTLKIVVESGGVSASFMSGNSEVRSVIEASLPQLKQELANQGLKVDNVGVYTSLDQFSANDQRGNAWQEAQKTNVKAKNAEGFIEAVEAVTQTATRASATGIDYRI